MTSYDLSTLEGIDAALDAADDPVAAMEIVPEALGCMSARVIKCARAGRTDEALEYCHRLLRAAWQYPVRDINGRPLFDGLVSATLEFVSMMLAVHRARAGVRHTTSAAVLADVVEAITALENHLVDRRDDARVALARARGRLEAMLDGAPQSADDEHCS